MKKFLLLFLFAFSVIITAQNYEELEPQFNMAVNLYKNYKYNEAISLFKTLEADEEDYASVSIMFIGKSYLELGQLDSSLFYCDRYLTEFPEGKYQYEMLMLKAKVLYEKGMFTNSIFELLNLAARDTIPNEEYTKNAINIAENNLSVDEIAALIDSSAADTVKPSLLLLAGKKYLVAGNIESSDYYFNILKTSYPNSPETILIDTLKEFYKQDPNYYIGVVLPEKNGQPDKATVEVLDGVKYAFSEFNKSAPVKIGLIIKEVKSKDDYVLAETEFSSVKNILAVIGPTFSGDVKDFLGMFKKSTLPLFSATANDEGLTNLHPTFYQLNIPYDIRSKVLARYIYYVENKKTLGILNSTEAYSTKLASNFASEFTRLGGKIIYKETYKTKAIELEQQLTKLNDIKDKLQGLYIPIADKSDAGSILSGFSVKDIKLQIYGNQDWMNVKSLDSYPFINGNLIAVSDYFIDYDSSIVKAFNNNFKDNLSYDVNKNVLYGYDMAFYLISVFNNWRDDNGKTSFVENLLSTKTIGIHNDIVLETERYNVAGNIVRYKNKDFEMIERHSLTSKGLKSGR